MIHRFDHAVIAVRDLGAAIERYRALGFEVAPGGRHVGRGTHNALIKFGLDYIELISVHDAAEAATTDERGRFLMAFLQRREGGCLGYCLAVRRMEEEVDRFARERLQAPPPFAMQRQRPDGRILSWRLLIPEGIAWRRPWPLLIEWDLGDAGQIPLEPRPSHGNGATHVAGVSIAVTDLEAAVDLYARQLGLPRVDDPPHLPEPGTRKASFQCGSVLISLLEPTGPGGVRETLDQTGPGLFEVQLAANDLSEARGALLAAGILPVVRSGSIDVPPDAAVGARIAFVDGSYSIPPV